MNIDWRKNTNPANDAATFLTDSELGQLDREFVASLKAISVRDLKSALAGEQRRLAFMERLTGGKSETIVARIRALEAAIGKKDGHDKINARLRGSR